LSSEEYVRQKMVPPRIIQATVVQIQINAMAEIRLNKRASLVVQCTLYHKEHEWHRAVPSGFEGARLQRSAAVPLTGLKFGFSR